MADVGDELLFGRARLFGGLPQPLRDLVEPGELLIGLRQPGQRLLQFDLASLRLGELRLRDLVIVARPGDEPVDGQVGHRHQAQLGGDEGQRDALNGGIGREGGEGGQTPGDQRGEEACAQAGHQAAQRGGQPDGDHQEDQHQWRIKPDGGRGDDEKEGDQQAPPGRGRPPQRQTRQRGGGQQRGHDDGVINAQHEARARGQDEQDRARRQRRPAGDRDKMG